MTYDEIRDQLETEARVLRDQSPRDHKGRPTVHLIDACAEALRRHPDWWTTYRAGIRAGLPPEFQRPHRRRSSSTPKAQAWGTIEMLARALVVTSRDPLTLCEAVVRVVETNPALYERYARTRRS